MYCMSSQSSLISTSFKSGNNSSIENDSWLATISGTGSDVDSFIGICIEVLFLRLREAKNPDLFAIIKLIPRPASISKLPFCVNVKGLKVRPPVKSLCTTMRFSAAAIWPASCGLARLVVSAVIELK